MPFPLSCWNSAITFFNNPAFFSLQSLLEVDLQLSEVLCLHAGWRRSWHVCNSGRFSMFFRKDHCLLPVNAIFISAG